ncbi:hypothetical protein SDC9_72465 [bioreactor metagenome]|uniref:Uncharacterized protein n=1 Tax=bioreactor metagenome TaxID=1076179 RepID=A0A644YIM4_9ZZZZ
MFDCGGCLLRRHPFGVVLPGLGLLCGGLVGQPDHRIRVGLFLQRAQHIPAQLLRGNAPVGHLPQHNAVHRFLDGGGGAVLIGQIRGVQPRNQGVVQVPLDDVPRLVKPRLQLIGSQPVHIVWLVVQSRDEI